MSPELADLLAHQRRYHRRNRHGGRYDTCRDSECRWLQGYVGQRSTCSTCLKPFKVAEGACHR